MCKKYPGPRCSFHTRQALTDAQEAFEANQTDENAAKVKEAQYAYNTSPDGIKALREAGNELDAKHFEAVRQQAIDHLKAVQAKEAQALRKELEGLYSEHGIEEVRAMGDDDLADRLEERGRRAEARKGNEAGVVFRSDFAKPEQETTEAPEVKKRSLLADAWDGAKEGAEQGWKNPKRSLMASANSGYNVGKRSAAEAESQETAYQRHQDRVAATQERETERADKAFEREQARIAREQARLEKADLIWHSKLEADCIRYIKAQKREAVKRSKAKHTAA